MASKKIYFNESSENPVELEAHQNSKGELFINVSPFPDTHSSDVWLTLSKEDAIDLISDLAYDFDLIDETEYLEGRIYWKGNTR
jgi:hypothetical protein